MMNKWSREETIIAFNLYCKIPFKDSSKSHPLVIEYANLLGRTPSALNMKIGNIGRLDPDLRSKGITGLAHGAKLEKDIWNEFHNDSERLAYESELLISKLSNRNIDESFANDFENTTKGEEREVKIKQRIGQSFFRTTVLTSYNSTCCISGVSHTGLIEACHILNWSQYKSERTNPKNGLCLNSLLHKAYDKNLIAVTPNYKVIISDLLIECIKDPIFKNYLKGINEKRIFLPNKFLPNKEFLEIRYNEYINANETKRNIILTNPLKEL